MKSTETLLEILHEYRDSHRDLEWLDEKLGDHWLDPEWDMPFCWALSSRIWEYDDGFCSKDFIDGMVEGALELVAPRIYTELDPKTNQPMKTIITGITSNTESIPIGKEHHGSIIRR